ncbi:hypothetical protein SAMN00790413_01159 [Deinococcus hopiensis KR-140]|uniref:Uncharacterized protein n=1 Tax=Deinococcus hopiensis KR-140 TaxID=695939 RepID=A0A1W1VDR0_9DEIO|nr:hypothetical protein SAMN00790413_01159 [Deinococcus hopiensis KR-140]
MTRTEQMATKVAATPALMTPEALLVPLAGAPEPDPTG